LDLEARVVVPLRLAAALDLCGRELRVRLDDGVPYLGDGGRLGEHSVDSRPALEVEPEVEAAEGQRAGPGQEDDARDGEPHVAPADDVEVPADLLARGA